MGLIGGGIWHAIKGARYAPKGQRLLGSLQTMKARSPLTGGGFAVWGGIFAVFDCWLVSIRKKEDPWNSIAAGGLTGGLLAARCGPKTAAKNAIAGAFILALIEGLGIMATKAFAPPVPTPEEYEAAARGEDPNAPSSKDPGLAPPLPPQPMYSFGGGSGASSMPSKLPEPQGFGEDQTFQDPYASGPGQQRKAPHEEQRTSWFGRK